jgi:hypothetical protein
VDQRTTRLPEPASDDPADVFATVVALRRLAAQLERDGVDHALDRGWTWAQIGRALGVSAQAAHKKLRPARR